MLANGGKPLSASGCQRSSRGDPHIAVEHQVPQFAIDQRAGVVLYHLHRYAEAANASRRQAWQARARRGQPAVRNRVSCALFAQLVAGGHATRRRPAWPALAAVSTDEVERGSRAGVRYTAGAGPRSRLQVELRRRPTGWRTRRTGCPPRAPIVPPQRDAGDGRCPRSIGGRRSRRAWIARSLRCSGRGPRHSTRARRRPSARRCCCKHSAHAQR